jgi:hypothetical protein
VHAEYLMPRLPHTLPQPPALRRRIRHQVRAAAAVLKGPTP